MDLFNNQRNNKNHHCIRAPKFGYNGGFFIKSSVYAVFKGCFLVTHSNLISKSAENRYKKFSANLFEPLSTNCIQVEKRVVAYGICIPLWEGSVLCDGSSHFYKLTKLFYIDLSVYKSIFPACCSWLATVTKRVFPRRKS